jgi:Flp pilus assembly pilin Flp
MRSFVSTRCIRRFLGSEDAATSIEYALIASGIAGAIVASITLVGGSVTTMWTSIRDAFGG